MSKELFEVLSLFGRYLFALLGLIIALRAFFWMLSDRADRKRRMRQLPLAGAIGEFVSLSAAGDLREGDSVPVPWEGILGSVRSCDIAVPCDGVHRKHLAFSWETGVGLLAKPFSGCDALVNGTAINCHSRPEEMPLTHGSILQVGSAMLRLRVFAALDPKAGFQDVPQDYSQPPVQQITPQQTFHTLPPQAASMMPTAWGQDQNIPPQVSQQIYLPPDQAYPQPWMTPPAVEMPPQGGYSPSAPDPETLPARATENSQFSEENATLNHAPAENSAGIARKRRSDRWEVDWSE